MQLFDSYRCHSLGDCCTDKGQTDKALEALKKAEAEFKDMGMDYWLGKTQKVISGLRQ